MSNIEYSGGWLVAAVLCVGCTSAADSPAFELGKDGISSELNADEAESPEDVTAMGGEVLDVAATYSVAFQPAGYVTDQPVLFLVESEVSEPGSIVVGVYGRQLGTVAGVAFYIQYDPERLKPTDLVTRGDFGNVAGVNTKQIAGVLRPGVISYGGARFCEEKSPWEPASCGGVPILNATEFLSVRFKALTPGDAVLSLPSSSVLVRSHDYSSVLTRQVGGTLRVSEVTP
jgi:hypothetical protein